MTMAWILYVLLVGTLLALAALSVDGILRRTALPTRWIWLAALGGIVALAILSPRREPIASGFKIPAPVDVAANVQALPRTSGGLLGMITTARDAISSSVSKALAMASRRTPTQALVPLAIVWLLFSASVISVLVIVSRRADRARRAWPLREVHGTPVRIAHATGPAVIGFTRPEIVVPSWLLDRTPDEQRLVIVHEREHVKARDQLLLAAGWLVAAMLPWHPAVWWSLSRLRLAIELDCDARVLHRGVQPRSYGSLLIDIAGQSAGHRIGALALADRTSHLERRLLAMKHSRTRFAFARAGLLCAIAFLSVVVACEARMPTSADVDAMSVEGAEKAAVASKLLAELKSANRIYMVDGRVVSEAEAHAIAPSKIASMDIRGRKSPGDKDEVRIYTLNQNKSLTDDQLMKMKTTLRSRVAVDSNVKPFGEKRLLSRKSFDGVVMIDGVASTSKALAELSHDQIASVEVFKGEAAAKMSSDPAAQYGIISVKTKAAKQ
jgi:beta-lactamase regulating signal transducer with metallopeptidase domain